MTSTDARAVNDALRRSLALAEQQAALHAEIREQLAAAQDAFETERLMWAPKRQEEVR